MKIGVVGAAYVGLVTAACFADQGHDVVCMDTDEGKIERLQDGIMPFSERGLYAIIQKASSRLRVTHHIAGMSDVDVAFICVGTPSLPDGRANLTQVFSAADSLASVLREDAVIAIKSTVPPGTAARVRDRLRTAFVASNPEFLRAGSAVLDCQHPDRIVIGTDDDSSARRLTELYRNSEARVIFMCTRSAELVKYGTNGMLAVRISLMNALADLASAVGADIVDVERGIGADSRVGSEFLEAGIGYGGSCFPKDLRALISLGKSRQAPQTILSAAEEMNENRRLWAFRQMKEIWAYWRPGKRVAVWGLAFKPGTDDIRNAASAEVINALLSRGAHVSVYDPLALDSIRRTFEDRNRIRYADSPLDAAEDAVALAVLTEDSEFRNVDLSVFREVMAPSALVVDGRNIRHPDEMRQRGFEYRCVGR